MSDAVVTTGKQRLVTYEQASDEEDIAIRIPHESTLLTQDGVKRCTRY